jgi:hypothetical protein
MEKGETECYNLCRHFGREVIRRLVGADTKHLDTIYNKTYNVSKTQQLFLKNEDS